VGLRLLGAKPAHTLVERGAKRRRFEAELFASPRHLPPARTGRGRAVRREIEKRESRSLQIFFGRVHQGRWSDGKRGCARAEEVSQRKARKAHVVSEALSRPFGVRRPLSNDRRRIVGIALMLVGIGFLAVLTATISSLFVKADRANETAEVLDVLRGLEADTAELKARTS
jgi:hypothetical protein